MIIEGKKAAELMQDSLREKAKILDKDSYIAILSFGDNYSSNIYVNRKQEFGKKIWISTKVFTDKEIFPNISDTNTQIDLILENIWNLNKDPLCLGIIIQLPLPNELNNFKDKLLSSISPIKDLDGLWWINSKLAEMWKINFLPATPKAVMKLLEYHQLDDLEGKKVSVIWQSNIVGKPLSFELKKRWAKVYSFDINNSIQEIQKYTKESDYIFACTGHVHLVDDSRIRHNQSQIIIDIWYGHINWKAAGDVNLEQIQDKALAYTPVPGGVWPLTVACLFDNIFDLQSQKEKLKTLI